MQSHARASETRCVGQRALRFDQGEFHTLPRTSRGAVALIWTRAATSRAARHRATLRTMSLRHAPTLLVLAGLTGCTSSDEANDETSTTPHWIDLTGRDVAVGQLFACGLRDNGEVICRDEANPGDLELSAQQKNAWRLELGGAATQINASTHDGCARMSDGTVRCWTGTSMLLGRDPSESGIDLVERPCTVCSRHRMGAAQGVLHDAEALLQLQDGANVAQAGDGPARFLPARQRAFALQRAAGMGAANDTDRLADRDRVGRERAVSEDVGGARATSAPTLDLRVGKYAACGLVADRHALRARCVRHQLCGALQSAPATDPIRAQRAGA